MRERESCKGCLPGSLRRFCVCSGMCRQEQCVSEDGFLQGLTRFRVTLSVQVWGMGLCGRVFVPARLHEELYCHSSLL